MPLELIERAMTLLPNVSFVNAYGLTETSSTIAVLGPDDHRDAVGSDDPRCGPGSVRSASRCPSLELEIRDPMGTCWPPGESGEIYVRGEQVAGEYLGRSVLTDDGWFPTHDGGHLDEGGFLFVEGRIDDVIVRGGENMSPGEIEDVLLDHPAVAEAGVIGVPDDEWGEAVAAAVVVDGDGHRGRAPGLGPGTLAVDQDPRAHRLPRRAALQRDRQVAAPGLPRRTRHVITPLRVDGPPLRAHCRLSDRFQ